MKMKRLPGVLSKIFRANRRTAETFRRKEHGPGNDAEVQGLHISSVLAGHSVIELLGIRDLSRIEESPH